MEEQQLKIEVIPAMECISAVQSYVEYCNDSAGNNIEDTASEINGVWVDSRLQSWREEVDREISPFLKNDLLFLFQYYSHSIILSYFIIYKNLNDPEEFLSSFKDMSTEEFLSLYDTLLHFDSDPPRETSLEEIVDILERDRTPLKDPQGEASQLLTLLETPEEFHQRMSRTLSQFYLKFVSPYMKEALKVLEDKRKEHGTLLDSRPDRFINTITRDNYSTFQEHTEEARIIITYFSESRLDLLMEGFFIIYGFLREKDFTDPDLETKTDTFLKALSDPNRIHILRLLKKRKYYGKEIAHTLGITTATVSYHLEKLMSARLIKLDRVQKKRILYTLNRDGIEDFLSSLEEEFLG